MNNHFAIHAFRTAMFATVALLFASKTFASTDYYLDFKDEKSGKVTKVHLADDGSFESPALPGGVYLCSWSFGASNPTPVRGSGMGAGQSTTTSDASAKGAVPPPVTIALSYEVKSPRDVATGQASGKRQYQPVTIRKEYDKASPQLNFGKIELTNTDKVTGRIELLDATGKKVPLSSWDLKSATK